VVNNYLKGNTPPPFDLLYWNSDSTNLPGAMYAYYVRNTYLENNLRTPGKLTMCGMPVDLGRIDMPAYVLAAREDHIVPWRTAYATNRLLGGPTQFVLAASGHIAGVINPPERKKRNSWLNADSDAEAETWISGAASQAGSWWPHWTDWLVPQSGPQIPARTALGSTAFPAVESAPGRYVRDKSA
jgi:polyhydroxyalkanoate synthase